MENTSEKSTSKYWLSLDQWRQDPEFLEFAEKEFRSSPLQENDGQGGWARREFLKLMGASLALTSFGCMRRPVQMIVPYAKKPREIIHGLANYYASIYVDGSEVFGTLVTSRDGRPIKIEGNPDFPVNKGGMSARAHSHILSLYDPERLNGPKHNLQNEKKTNHETVAISFEDLDKAVIEQLKKGSVAVLTSSLNSPTTNSLLKEFASAYGAKVYTWDALNLSDVRAAQKLSYGQDVLPRYRLEKAKLVVSVGNDFLGSHANATANARSFSQARKPGKEMLKLVVFEGLMSLTGTNADERYRVSGPQELDVLMGLAHQIFVSKKFSRYSSDSQVTKALEGYADVDVKLGLKPGTLATVADELIAAKGQSLVLTGGWSQSENSVAAQVVANLINSALENDGSTVDYSGASPFAYQGSASELNELVAAMASGKVKTLIVHGVNPGYAAVSSGFTEASKKTEMFIYTGDRIDETGHTADYLVPDHHPLENWDDVEAAPGVYAIQQPTIQPLYETRAFQDSLLMWLKGAPNKSARASSSANWYEYLRSTWKDSIYANHRTVAPAQNEFDDFWIAILHSGVFATRTSEKGSPRNFTSSAMSAVKPATKSEGYTLQLYANVGLRDGSLANVSWLQEFPDPVTKICWDNYLTVSPADAAKEKLKEGDLVELNSGDTTLEVPVHIQPGQAEGILGLAYGYGRTRAGKVANGVGRNAFQLVRWEKGQAFSSGLSAKIKKTGSSYELAATQDHHSMEGRQIVVEATLAEFMKEPGANIHRHKMMTMWNDQQYPNNKWGMVIDLNSCTGCGSCVIACQSENNIPTVGKKYVLRSREMHWIRIDRYYVGNPDDPGVVHQPIVCMHCDNAPCETVCPVMATVHSDEGTNDMIYNRCVGTRYCSNNCPYKVRRFNWFNNVKTVEKPLNYAMNPEVTVRARGVMEKCTFCIHRIRSEKSRAKLQDRVLKDGDVTTACQQSCPTQAITFGDLNDSESRVRKMFDAENAYTLLEELNAKPAVKYQTKIRNTSELKGGSHHGHEEGAHS